ncbi:MAG: PorV/PorQ family protein [bacterium]
MKRFIFIIFLVFLMVISPLFGGITITKYAGAFLETGVGARPFGMGGAFTALSGDVTAIYWNPAGMVNIKNIEFHGMHAERFSGIVNWDFVGGAVRINDITSFGIGYFRLGVDGIPLTRLTDPSRDLGEVFIDDNGTEIENTPYAYKYVNDSESALFFSFARNINKKIAYGGSIKFIYKSVSDYNAWGLGFDVSIMYNPFDALKLGLLISDGTSTLIAWNTGRKELILPHLRFGSAYHFNYSFLQFLPVLDLSFNFENRGSSQITVKHVGIDIHAGMEVRFKKMIAFRVGSNCGFFTAGSGIKLSSFRVDYGFSHHTDLDNTHRISLTYMLQ